MPGHSCVDQLDQRRRDVGGEGRMASLVVDEGQVRVRVGQSQDGLHHVGSVFATHPRRAHDGGIDADGPFTEQLRSP